MPELPYRYVSSDEDSGRWIGFPIRRGDIVISTRSKSGTTWMQMICALLVFGSSDLPRPLGELSPWLDHLATPREDVYAYLAAQQHRRVIKTHTPLDGIPLDPGATYLVVARDPLDTAVSLYHQIDNIDRERLRELTGAPPSTTPAKPQPPLRDWLVSWVEADVDPRESMDSLPGVMWHLSDAWARRKEPNVMLIHYTDLSSDLDGQMSQIANQLGISVPERIWPSLVQAATFDHMKSRAGELVPNRAGILKDNAAFFRRGRSGAGREVLTDKELAAYHTRVEQLAPSDLLAWLHR
jgi:aryl sulfotransferase